MSITLEKVKNDIEDLQEELNKAWDEKENNNSIEVDRLQALDGKIESSMKSLINKLTTGQKGENLKKNKESKSVLKELRILSNHTEKLWREKQLLNPESLIEFQQALWWFMQQGDRTHLSRIKTIRYNPPYTDLGSLQLLEKVQKTIEEKLLISEVYQVFCSEYEIKQLFPEIVIIQAYKAFVIVSVDVDDKETITQIKNRYPVEQLSNNPDEDSKETTMVKKEHIVQFRFPVRHEWKQRIEDTGANILQPLGNSEFVVSIPNPEILNQIKQFREVDSVTPYKPIIRVKEKYLSSLGVELTDEMLAEARLKISEKSEDENNIIPGILIARFFTEEDQKQAVKTLENERIDVVDQPDVDEIIVDLINYSNPLNAYQIIKNLPGLVSLEEETIETTCNHLAVSRLAKGTSPTNHISGLTGKGEIIAIADTGLDLRTGENTVLHSDFDGRIKKIESYPIKPSYSSRVHNPNDDDGASDKYSGHGTHVAGSALGSGEMAQKHGLPPIRGMAPEAELIFQAIEQTPQWTEQTIKSLLNQGIIPPASSLLGIPSNLEVLFKFAYNNNARIHSNSWEGSVSGSYERQCFQVDKFVWENKKFLIVFAAGNKGNQKGTITPPGTAKNCITVGALAEFSSRGPCQDGRLKPDVIAPGLHILSTRSCQITHHSEAPYPPAEDCYMYMSGTSMATPLVAGSAALVREYFRTRKNISDPSAALVKAALIHSAEYNPEPSSHKWVDNKQGWGMINLSRIIDLRAPNAIEFFDRHQGFLDSGEKHEYNFEIINNSIPLQVTLVYTDYPGKLSLSNLVNNLNIEVYNPQGKYYLGNDFEDRGVRDKINNVEGCIIDTPMIGTWKIRIVGETIAQPPQDYALVISGAFRNWQQISS